MNPTTVYVKSHEGTYKWGLIDFKCFSFFTTRALLWNLTDMRHGRFLYKRMSMYGGSSTHMHV